MFTAAAVFVIATILMIVTFCILTMNLTGSNSNFRMHGLGMCFMFIFSSTMSVSGLVFVVLFIQHLVQ